ncbi:MAG: hypothetical protein JWO82_4360 [Akkermansiaceae bacterium]|nr:hypothetical protein [Akkermansiaceae bacterium]
MILPQNLTPLPLGPRSEDSPQPAAWDGEDFVLSNDIHRLLLGATGGLPVECLPAEDFDSFAGRSDVVIPRTAATSSLLPSPAPALSSTRISPFIALAGSRPLAAAPARMTALHPAFETLTAARRAAPPRIVMDVEKDYGKSARGGDRWWMLGVALAVGAITLSGTFVDFTSREAVRRAGMEQQSKPHSSAATSATLPAPAEKAAPKPVDQPPPLMDKARAIASAQAGGPVR